MSSLIVKSLKLIDNNRKEKFLRNYDNIFLLTEVLLLCSSSSPPHSLYVIVYQCSAVSFLAIKEIVINLIMLFGLTF